VAALPSLQRISDHVYWLPPAPPDRPALCAVVGAHWTVMLDAGASAAHARLFLDGLSSEGVSPPSHVAFTHSHWDHVFGAAEVGAPVIAHAATADALTKLAATDWSDDALERRVAAGEVSAEHAANVKDELPSPRDVQIAPADIVFTEGLDLDLGEVKVLVRHVGGDHAADSSVMYVEPDDLLFLGDCLYDAPRDGGLTPERVFPLHDAILGFGAELHVEGHGEAVLPRAELERFAAKARLAETLVGPAEEGGPDDAAVLARVREQVGGEPDEDLVFLVHAFIAGRRTVNIR
jgi:glyoxylase-like metal-dependent hydrolase (beta-lactamase superfamily II)